MAGFVFVFKFLLSYVPTVETDMAAVKDVTPYLMFLIYLPAFHN